jgi:hypothetical protein
MKEFIWKLHVLFKTKTWYKDMFQAGYCDCESCPYLDKEETNYEYQEYEWSCLHENIINFAYDDMEECPLSRKMPLEKGWND